MAASPWATFAGHTSSVRVTDTFTFVRGSSTAATVEVAATSGVINAGAVVSVKNSYVILYPALSEAMLTQVFLNFNC